jgi:hypothetical protein
VANVLVRVEQASREPSWILGNHHGGGSLPKQ